MEILALAMISLFLLVCILIIYLYVKLKNRAVNKKFNEDEYDFSIDDDNDIIDNNSTNDIINDNLGNNTNDGLVPLVPKEIVEVNHNKELVNVLIDNKNYIFLANNNKVSKGEHIKLIVNNKTYFGTITKANYMRDISTMKVKPIKLIIKKNKSLNETSEFEEFIPKRKNDK